MKFGPSLAEITRDNTSGSQEIARRAGDLFLRMMEDNEPSSLEELREVLTQAMKELLRAHPVMASLFHLFNRVLLCLDESSDKISAVPLIRSAIREFRRELNEHNRQIALRLADLIEGGTVVLTHSASGSVREGLCYCREKGKRFSVICTESRPALEGAALARDLTRHGIPTSLIADSLSHALLAGQLQSVPKVSLVLVGADAVSEIGLTNKAGTLGLALAARRWSVPFFAAAGSEKFLPAAYPLEKAIQKYQAPEEILAAPPQGLTIINGYFDLTPLSCLTGVITEADVFSPSRVRDQLRELSPHSEILRWVTRAH